MKVLALQGLRGGTGTSSTTAALAEALSRSGEAVLVIDLDPRNLLRLYFNHSWHDERGWARAWWDGHAWHQAAFEIDLQLHFLPHGRLEPEALDALNSYQLTAPQEWKQRLATLDTTIYDWVLIDVPASDSACQQQAHRVADIWLRIAHADPACHALLADHTIRLNEYLLINRFLPQSPLQSDLHVLWQKQYHDWLVPLAIHQDEAMFETLANKQGVVSYRPESLAAQDIQRLAAWLMTHSQVVS